MIYIDEEGKTQCTDCCIACEEDKKSCEAVKERKRAVRREIYKAKKERKKEGLQ